MTEQNEAHTLSEPETVSVSEDKSTTVLEQEKEPKQMYPTLAMLAMMQKLDEMERRIPAPSIDEIDLFRQLHVVSTHLKHRHSLIMIAAIFAVHRTEEKQKVTYQQKMAELEGLDKKLGEEMKWIAEFYCRLLDRYQAQQYVFYALTVDQQDREPFDLLESAQSVRFITIQECNACGKKPVPLQLCIKCHKAAYCNRECQKLGWSFHKKYCNYLQGNNSLLTQKK